MALILTVIAGDKNTFQIIGLENPRITHISVSLVFSIVIATVTDKNTENDQVFRFCADDLNRCMTSFLVT